jgi:UDP-N-acetyl-D-glucosamine dehydrogenase
MERLPSSVADRSVPIVVLGQGYVGLTLAAAAAGAGFTVTGIDIDETRVSALSRGELVVPGVDEKQFREGFDSGHLTFAVSPRAVEDAQLILICVPTPLRDGIPDLRYVEAAARDVGEHLRFGSLVVLESTTYPGTTDQLVGPIIESVSGLRAGTDFWLAYSPERIDPGNAEFSMRDIPRIVGGTTPQATEAAMAFYGQLVEKVVAVSSPRVAEGAKLLENTFRHINVALVNELTMLMHDLDVDVWEMIDAAATKPFGYMPFYPGPGIGGHCIPLDPTYLSWQVHQQTGRHFGVLEQAQDVNDRMPNYIASRVGEILNAQGRAVNGARILVLGIAYKPDVGDVRESPALHTMQTLRKRGADVRFHDFFIDQVPMSGEAGQCVRDLDEELSGADLVVLLTPHTAYDLASIAERSRVVFDTRNAYGPERRENVIKL